MVLKTRWNASATASSASADALEYWWATARAAPGSRSYSTPKAADSPLRTAVMSSASLAKAQLLLTLTRSPSCRRSPPRRVAQGHTSPPERVSRLMSHSSGVRPFPVDLYALVQRAWAENADRKESG